MKSIVLAGIAALLVSASPEATGGWPESQQRSVSYSDLDLSEDADVRKLSRRISSAAKEVCGTASDADPAGKNKVRRCRTVVRKEAHAQRDAAVAFVRQQSPLLLPPVGPGEYRFRAGVQASAQPRQTSPGSKPQPGLQR